MRTGPVHRARKLHLHHRLVPARSYTYYPAGNLLTDSYRNIFQSTMGRANLPFTLMKDIQGAQYREAYLYNTADQRIYKEEDRYAQDSEVSQVVTSEFHLLDAGGHDLGVLDLNTGKWEWYIFGAQRFAKLTPANDQQPAFVSTDLSGLAPEPKPGEVELENLLNCLGSLVGNTQLYPLTLVRYKTGEIEPVKYDEQSVFNAIPASAQATIIPVGHPLSFRSGKDRLTLSTDPRSSYSIDALMKMAMQRNGPISFPFAYTYPANTALNKVTYYEHDHLGNLRVAFTPVVDCSNPTGTEPDPGLNHPNSSFTLDQVVDYFPYGKILRQYVASNGPERFLTTQHERDQETGLDYRGARYYDSDIGRFLSLDPKAADYASWSPYNYVMGNPVSLVDPDGRSATKYEDENGKYLGDDGVDNGLTMQVTQAKWNEVNGDKRNLGSDGKLNTIGQAKLSIDGKITDSPELRALRAEQQNDPTNKVIKASVTAIGALAADDPTGIGTLDDVLIPIVTLATDVYLIGTMISEMAAEHTKGARPSTWGTHSKPRPGRESTKNRGKKKWKDYSGKRNRPTEDGK